METERDRASYGYIKRLDMTKNRHFEFGGTTKEISIKQSRSRMER